jgi:stress-induced morphogen
MDASILENLIKKEIPDAVVQVQDVRGDGLYFSATVTSGQFAGMSRIQQHSRVYRAIGPLIGDDAHAVQLTTRVS